MKKVLIVTALLTSAVLAYGQFYPKLGLSAALTSRDNPSVGNLKEQLKAGFVAGIGYNIQLGNFAIAPELLFVQKGSSSQYTYEEPPFISINQTAKYTLNYLELPVLFRYNLGPEALRFYGQFGPSFAVGLGGKGSYEETADLGNGPTTVSYDYTVKFEKRPEGYEGNDAYIENKTDVGIQFGGGVIIANRIMADIRYGLGFTDWGDELNTKNRALQISVGILLGR